MSASQGDEEKVRLDRESIEAIACRVVELLGEVSPAPDPEPRQHQLLTAAQVARRWGVERAWVYQHAERLGAIRLGTGPRPRLRFDSALLARQIGAPASSSAAIEPDRGPLLPIHGEAELSSPSDSTDRPGGATTPPATAPKRRPSAQ